MTNAAFDKEVQKALNDAHNKQVAKEGSWLCRLFQKYDIPAQHKQKIMKELIIEFRLKELEMDKAIRKEKKSMDKGLEKLEKMDKKNDKKHEKIGEKKAMMKKGC